MTPTSSSRTPSSALSEVDTRPEREQPPDLTGQQLSELDHIEEIFYTARSRWLGLLCHL